MAPQNFGALGATYTVVRGMQAISMISIIGMTANFISEMVSAKQSPPSVLIGTLSVTCIAVLYVAVTYILYFDALLPFLISSGLDGLFLIAVIVVAVTVGKPLSYLDCTALPSTGVTSSFLDSVGANMSKVNYWVWAGASKTTCFEMKAIWGFSIALCILFALSSVCSICMWKKQRMSAAAAAPHKDVEH
ncbi:hypothetical protein M430DRAFT_128998 [Amorphotheca resinae ATCC 22711]|uniref:MARVEL domain-containing protein n=1 Tax=Amorphotheca resinae ATCC 22711 TaxID=857342 RepID=A0A2T3AR63_AMORE|nr:hypothetical protein M430DRAFT_128998 [Amorphotheca resinae ATCC 22711]PSS08755.1 hypothetical protein M430DRAFT_128998 [Amorphotheca resinae ATCC 22711]